jgi:hypothetical protein
MNLINARQYTLMRSKLSDTARPFFASTYLDELEKDSIGDSAFENSKTRSLGSLMPGMIISIQLRFSDIALKELEISTPTELVATTISTQMYKEL